FLEALAPGALGDLTSPRPTTALALCDRLRQAGRADARGIARLPSIPPFTGRDEVLARLVELAIGTRQGQAKVVLLRGVAGAGKSRLLQQFVLTLERWITPLLLQGGFDTGAPEARTGIVAALESLALHGAGLP